MNSIEKLLSTSLPMNVIIEYIYEQIFKTNEFSDALIEFRKLKFVNRQFAAYIRDFLQKKFQNVVLFNCVPFDGVNWTNSDVWEYDFSQREVFINDARTTIGRIKLCLTNLYKHDRIQFKSIELFPVDRDLCALPPPMCERWIRFMADLHYTVEKIGQCLGREITKYTFFEDTMIVPGNKETHFDRMVLSANYLESAANRLHFSQYEKDRKEEVLFKSLQTFLDSVRCDKLTMFITDCININDDEMASGELLVPAIGPFDVLQRTLNYLKPKILSIKLCSEVVPNADAAYRLDWDEYDIIDNFSLYSGGGYSEILNKSIGDELKNIPLVVDTDASIPWSQMLDDYDFAKDLLEIFPMKNVIFGVTYHMNSDLSDELIRRLKRMLVVTSSGTYNENRNIHFYIMVVHDAARYPLESLEKDVFTLIDGFNNFNTTFLDSEAAEFFENYATPYLDSRVKNVYGLEDIRVKKYQATMANSATKRRVHFCLNVALRAEYGHLEVYSDDED